VEDNLHDTYIMYNLMSRGVMLSQNVTWATWKPSTLHDTLEHVFETNPDGIADQEDDIKDTKWADG
jgi:lambda repressor-like predicted transcriptional regulator